MSERDSPRDQLIQRAIVANNDEHESLSLNPHIRANRISNIDSHLNMRTCVINGIKISSNRA